jgi:hypothetical protein
MLTVDNSVELMLRTYLNLPRRETGLQIPAQDLKEAQRSFPGLLDAMERYAPGKFKDVSLSNVEWYHTLRNELYHQGNGLTVEQSRVETYGRLAGDLFKVLFGHELRPAGIAEVRDLLEPATVMGVGGRTKPGDGIDSDWTLLQHRASEELFRVVRTLWDRIESAVKVEGLPWVPRLYVKHGYFTFQQTTGRRNVIGCVFRTHTRSQRAELSISLPAAPEELELGQLFRNPQRWDKTHSQVLILVDDQLGIPNMGKAVSIARRFNA